MNPYLTQETRSAAQPGKLRVRTLCAPIPRSRRAGKKKLLRISHPYPFLFPGEVGYRPGSSSHGVMGEIPKLPNSE